MEDIQTKPRPRFRVQITDLETQKKPRSSLFTIYTNKEWSLVESVQILKEKLEGEKK